MSEYNETSQTSIRPVELVNRESSKDCVTSVEVIAPSSLVEGSEFVHYFQGKAFKVVAVSETHLIICK